MDNYKLIVKALEELRRLAYLVSCCYVKFRIEPRNDYYFYDPELFPAVMINAKTEGEGFILKDMSLSISLFLDGNHEVESKELFEKLKKSKLKEYFPEFPDSFGYGPFYVNVGKDFNIIADLVIQMMYLLSNCKDFEIIPEFNAFLDLQKKESLDKCKVNTREVSIAVKNGYATGLPLLDKTSIRMDIMRERLGGYDFLGDIVINKKYKGGYHAFITSAPLINRPLDLIIRNLKQYVGALALDGGDILNNSIELRISFQGYQEEAFLQLVTEIFKILYPSLKPRDISAQLTYNNFISNPTVCLKYLFHSDGSAPSEKELKYGRQLIDNFEAEDDSCLT